MNPISIPHQLSLIEKPYTQTLLASLDNTHEIKIALLDGPYIFHSHPDNDEAFYLISGSLVIEIEGENGVQEVKMKEGDLFVVERGVRHRPIGDMARVMVVEKKGVLDGSGVLAKPIDVGERQGE
jgi:mannose-6-phosphate isomerase-like protein (cupin superfamily)